MVATFNPSLLTEIDRMRDALGDINVAAPFAPDETYLARLEEAAGDWRLAGAAMARSFASRAINSPTSFTAVGDVAVSWADRANAWLKIAAHLEAESSRLVVSVSRSSFWVAQAVRSDANDAVSDEYSVELRR